MTRRLPSHQFTWSQGRDLDCVPDRSPSWALRAPRMGERSGPSRVAAFTSLRTPGCHKRRGHIGKTQWQILSQAKSVCVCEFHSGSEIRVAIRQFVWTRTKAHLLEGASPGISQGLRNGRRDRPTSRTRPWSLESSDNHGTNARP